MDLLENWITGIVRLLKTFKQEIRNVPYVY